MPVHPALGNKLLWKIVPLRVTVDLVRVVHNQDAVGDEHAIDDEVLVCLAGKSESNRREVASGLQPERLDVFDVIRVQRVRNLATIYVLRLSRGMHSLASPDAR